MIDASSELETPERDLALERRVEGPAPPRQVQKKRPPSGDAQAVREELAALRARIEAARTLTPAVRHRVHNCRTCFVNARDATIRAIVGDEER
jgi:alkylation response protein AidB-like acyl-CoA dehydrogenase